MAKVLDFVAVVAFCFICCCNAQVLRRGSCPKVTAMPNLEMKKFMGIWYEQVHTRRWSGDLRCSVEYFSSTGPNSFHINSFTYSPSVDRSYQIMGDAEFKAPDGNALFNVTIPDLNLTGTVWLLHTDYKSYAVIWSCKNAADDKYFENLFIVTRDKHSKSGPILSALSVLTSRKIPKSSLQYVSQSSCPNYDGLLVEMNRKFTASAAEKIAPNSQIDDIDIRMKADAPPDQNNSNSTS